MKIRSNAEDSLRIREDLMAECPEPGSPHRSLSLEQDIHRFIDGQFETITVAVGLRLKVVVHCERHCYEIRGTSSGYFSNISAITLEFFFATLSGLCETDPVAVPCQ